MPREGSRSYVRTLLDQAHDVYRSSTDDQQAARTLPLVLQVCQNMLALIERLEGQVKFAQASILEIENSLALSQPKEENNVVDEKQEAATSQEDAET